MAFGTPLPLSYTGVSLNNLGVDVSSIVVPVRETGAGIPPKAVLEEMIEGDPHSHQRSCRSDRSIRSGKAGVRTRRIAFWSIHNTSISFLIRGRKTPLSLSGNGFGTWFIVAPTASELNDDIDRFPEAMGTSNFNKVLLGFANTMGPRLPAGN